MPRTLRSLSLAAVAALLLPALVAAKEPGLVLTGTLVDSGGVLPFRSSAPVTLRVDRFTSDEEAADLATVLREHGSRALVRELFGARLGTLEVNESIGYPIAFARTTEDASGRHLLLVVRRPISPYELWYSTRSVDYPFTVIEIALDREGRGSGDVLPASRVRFRDDGTVELQNLFDLPLRLLAVRQSAR